MVAEKFELQSYEMFQNEGFSNVTLNIFTMVEDNFEWQSSEMLQYEGFTNVSIYLYHG